MERVTIQIRENLMYILAIDQGTTGSTSMIVDGKTFNIISKVKH